MIALGKAAYTQTGESDIANNLKQWLECRDLGKYTKLFAENEIDLAALPHIVDQDLKDLGVALGARRKILAAVRAILDTPKNSLAPVTGLQGKVSFKDAERRQLTVMFCDMVGSTMLSARFDPEDYRDLIRAYQDACAGEIARYDGYVARFMGDGVLAYFGWPRSHEDDAARAINAGLRIIESVNGIATSERGAEPPAVRIGVATGSVVIGDIVGEGSAQEAAVMGETPNRAARLQDIAAANVVLIDGETLALAGGLFDYATLGPQKLKGIDGTPEVWRVTGERQVESRFAAAHGEWLTPLIGRDDELEILSRRWQRARNGDGQVVLLSGEPGIGKSRLARAMQDTIDSEWHARLLFQCSPNHTNSALHPVISHLEFTAGFAKGDDAMARLDKLDALMAGAGNAAADRVALIAALLSVATGKRHPLPRLTPQQLKDRTLAALIDHLAEMARDTPVLFAFEDAHWIDPTTMELLDLAVERIKSLPILIVITYRPEFLAPWVGDAHVTSLVLDRLAANDCTRIAEDITGAGTLSPEALVQIAERSDGIPLFVEELTRSIQEAGTASDLNDDRRSAAVVIPATLHDALEARFDRSPAAREVAQVGAAIGREFPYDLLARVVSLPSAELNKALDDLVAAGLVFARGAPPDASYNFKHALIQDTAYGSMLRSTRQATHRRVVEALLDLRPSVADTKPETLAHHYTEAGLVDEAIDWWTRAGHAAAARSANPEAAALLERGLNLVSNLPETEARHRRELALQTALFGPLISVNGQFSTELEAAFNRTLEICQQVDAPEEMFRAVFAKSLSHGMRGQHLQFNAVAEDLLQRADHASDEGALLMGHRQVACSLLLLGRVAEAQEHIDIVLSTFDRERHGHVMVTYGQDPAAIAEAYKPVCQWVLGWPEKSQYTRERAIAGTLELDHVSTIGPVLSWGGFIAQAISRDTDGLRQTSERFRVLTSQHKMPIWEVIGRLSSAVLESMTNPSHETVIELRSVLVDFASMTPNSMFFPMYWAGFLAENYLAIGEPAKALVANEMGFELAEASGEHWTDSELLRVRGVALARRDGVKGNDEAETSLRRAIDDARSRSAKSFELRAATSLADFLREQGHTIVAHEALAPIYGWFTEGFGTPDLIDARALLDKLA